MVIKTARHNMRNGTIVPAMIANSVVGLVDGIDGERVDIGTMTVELMTVEESSVTLKKQIISRKVYSNHGTIYSVTMSTICANSIVSESW